MTPDRSCLSLTRSQTEKRVCSLDRPGRSARSDARDGREVAMTVATQ